MKGCVSVSWGSYGGFYLHPKRVCLGWVAFTWLPKIEIDDLMHMPRAKAPFPADDMIVLAALMGANEHGTEWVEAEMLASVLRRLGFVISPQKMVGQMKRLLAEDSPMFERRENGWGGPYEYRVTRFGLTQLENRFPVIRSLTRYWRERLR